MTQAEGYRNLAADARKAATACDKLTTTDPSMVARANGFRAEALRYERLAKLATFGALEEK